MHVLLIEDSPVDAQALRDALARLPDVIIEHVETIEAARALLPTLTDVVLLDLSLEDSEGLDTVRRTRAALGEVPIVVLTSDRDESVAFEALREGAEDYLSKGAFTSDSLLRSIRYAVERHSLKTRLMRADRLATVGQLAAGVAHEVSNPASFVLGNSLALKQHVTHLGALLESLIDSNPQALTATKAQSVREEIAQAAVLVDENLLGIDRIAKVTRELQSYARLGEPEAASVDVNDLVREACALVRNTVRHRAVLAMQLGDVPRITVDPAKLSQVITNLLINAEQSFGDRARDANEIRVATRVTDSAGAQSIEIMVADSGCGIAKEHLNQVFEPFFTTKPKESGTGLGLSMAREIVRLHGGEIRCLSEVGVGTSFIISLPIDNGLQLAVAEPSPSIVPADPAKRARILLVDDEPAILKVFRAFLEPEHDVTTADSGESALRLLVADPSFDLIVCDYSMPGMTGIALWSNVLQAAPALADRFVFCSGAPLSDAASTTLIRSGSKLLCKPLRPAALLSAVNSRLRELVANTEKDAGQAP